MFGRWGHSSATASKHVATRSVLNPLLWLSAIITPVCVVAALFASDALLYALIGLAALPPLATVLGFLGFAFSNPNRLQSEEFIIQQQLVAAQIGDNRTREVITLDGQNMTPSTNAAMVAESSQ